MADGLTDALAASLRYLADEFKADELAYLSLTSKNEREMCNALAWRLHEWFRDDAETEVAREWKRHDIAVLHRDRPVALIEAKAAMSFNLVEEKLYPSNEVVSDIEKLRRVDFECKRFVLPFFTHYRHVPQWAYKANRVITYVDDMRKHGVIQAERVWDGLMRFRKATGDLAVVAQGEVPAGHAFGIDVSVLYLLLAVSD